MKRVVHFTAAEERKSMIDRKAKNILKVYVWNEVRGLNLNAKSIAYELNVTVRTAYRYLALIEQVKGEL